MFKTFIKSAVSCVFLLFLVTAANAQESESSPARKVLNGTGKVTIVVVERTAKLTYQAAKFSAVKIAKPIIIKSAPAVGKFILKQTGNTI